MLGLSEVHYWKNRPTPKPEDLRMPKHNESLLLTTDTSTESSRGIGTETLKVSFKEAFAGVSTEISLHTTRMTKSPIKNTIVRKSPVHHEGRGCCADLSP
eukprot:TRINITY_DN57414_c0_g1_i1.p2 TRINITY_DN57414_c0_g1~~TRINITY_DN57414_c0_g1_i1.p2  ORF type:complete len:100 (-),score=18.60 TRINITY_DN57414_c0_g1_i1:53-352(-)